MENLESMSDEPSFVILGPGSIPLSLSNADSMPSLPTYHPANPSWPLDSSKFESTASMDIQTKLDQLLQENRELKDALNQNNMAMKSQFDTLAMWQQEVLSTHQNHKQKFAETRELVLKLKSENATLKSSLDKIADKRPADDASIGSSSSLGSELATLHRKNNRLESEKLILVKERDAFREECTRLTLIISSLENTLRIKTEELVILRGNYESLSYQPSDVTDLCTPREANVALVQASTRRSDPKEESACVQPSMRQPESMTSWMCVDQPRTPDPQMQGLVQEVANLEKLLREEKLNSQAIQDRFDELQEQLKQLDNKKPEEKSASEAKEKADELKKLTDELELKDKLLKVALAELRQERTKIDQLEHKCQGMAILQAQVDVYKCDYEDERGARERAVADKEALAEELRLLKAQVLEVQAANQQLARAAAAAIPVVATNEPAQETGPEPTSAVIGSEEEAAGGEAVSDAAEQDKRPYTCPVCSFRFAILEECEAHVNPCLDVSMLP